MAEEWLKQVDLQTPAPSEDWVNRAASQVTERQNFVIGKTLDQALRTNPEQHAKTLDSAKKLQIPPEMAIRNADEVNLIARRDDIAQKLNNAPYLKRAFEDPDFAALAQDDVENLSNMEYVGRLLSNVGKSSLAGITEAPGNTYSALAAITDVFSEYSPEPTPWPSISSKPFFKRTTEKLLDWAEKADRTPEWLLEGVYEGTTPTEAAVYSGFQSTGNMITGLLASILTGNPAPALTWAGTQEGGRSAQEAREAGKSPLEVFGYGLTNATIEVGTELAPQLQLLSDLKLGSSLFKTFMGQVATEVPQEQIATILQDMNQLVTLRPDATFGDYLAERPMAAYQTLISTLVGTGANTTISHGTVKAMEKLSGVSYPETVGEQPRARDALSNEGLFEEMDRVAKNSTLRQRSPEYFQKYTDQLAQEAGADSVYIDGQAFFQTLEDAGIDPAKVAEQVPSIGEQMDSVSRSGGDFHIPLSEYMAKMAGTEYGQPLVEHARFNPEDMSAAEARQWGQQAEEKFKAESEQILNDLSEKDSFRQSADQVYNRVRDELVQSGRVTPDVAKKNAELHKAFATVIANKHPDKFPTPASVYERYGLRVEGAPVSGELAYNQEEVESLIAELKSIEEGFEPLRRAKDFGEKWEAQEKKAAAVRRKLMELTGDPYGRPKKKKRAPPSAERLDAEYLSPDQVPPDVMEWAKSQPILTSDASDAVRWGRIVDTQEDDRYDEGAMTVYRAVEAGDEIRPGDWVTTDREYAEDHLRKSLDGKGEILEETVDGKDVLVSPTGNFEEAIYAPMELSGPYTPDQPEQPTLYQDEIQSTFGIDVEEITDDAEAQKIIEEYQRRTQAVRSDVQSQYDLYRTVGERDAPQGWAEATRIKGTDGQPLLIHRGAKNPLSERSFFEERLGGQTKHPSSGLGVWFSQDYYDAKDHISRQGGGQVESFYLNIQNPKVYHPGDLPGFNSVSESIAFREKLRTQGFDGIVIDGRDIGAPVHFVAFDPEQVVTLPEKQELFQSAYHGSPHRFTKFTTAKMGSGEGAQAYGWGLYFAENLDVAKNYAPRDFAYEEKIQEKYNQAERRQDYEAMEVYERALLHETPKEIREIYNDPESGYDESIITKANEIANEIEQIDIDAFTMYEVDIDDAALANFLDWDAPLSGQPEKVQKALESYLKEKDPRYYKAVKEFEDGDERAMKKAGFNVFDYSGMAGQIYEHISSIEGSPKKASQLLNSKGIKGMRYLDEGSREGGVGTHNLVVFDENIVTITSINDKPVNIGLTEYNQGEPGPAKRGAIQFPGGGIAEGDSIISLLEGADLSTFLHETGHFFFEVYRDIASDPASPEQIRSDMSALLDFVGVDSLEAWNAMSFEERRNGHEKVAEAFEVYLFEGKAPSMEMQSLFRTFRAWLKNAYRQIQKYLSPEKITPEVRQVFSRMLATEEQIAEAEKARGYAPLFKSAEEAGMTEKQWAEYQSQLEAAHTDAIEELESRMLKDMKWLSGAKSRELKKVQREAGRIRKSIREQVKEEVLEQPVHRARFFLRNGYLPGETEGKPIKLDRAVLREQYEGTDINWKSLTSQKLTQEDGILPDDIAPVLGFDNGDAMVRAMISEPSLEDAVSILTDRRMLEEHGDVATQEALEEAATEAVHNAARAKFLATEGRFLAKLSKTRAPDNRAAKEAAQNIIATTRVRDMRVAKFEAQERKYAKRVIEAWRKNDPQGAAEASRQQLLNFYLAKYGREAQTEAEKIVKHAKKYDKPSVRKNLRGEHLEQLDAFLARFDFRKSVSDARRDQTLSEYMESESDRIGAVIPDIPAWILDEGFRLHYRDMTMEDLRGVYDAMRQLDHLARREQKMYIKKKNMSFAQEEAAILDEFREIHPDLFENGETIPYSKDNAPYIKELRGRLRSKFDAEFISMENLLDIMTVGRGKQVFSSLFSRISDAADEQTRFMKELAAYLKPYTGAYSLKERSRFSTKKIFIPELNKYLSRDQLISIALYNGNEEGRQRLRDGNKFSEAGISAALAKLDERDWAFVNAYWEMSDELIWPKLEALEKRTKGVAPPKVSPVPYQTRFGMVRGGYVPLVYDGETNTRSMDINTDQSVKEMLGGTARQAVTSQGASKERLAKVNRELDLSIGAMAYKINETVHDVTHREAIADTWRLLRSGPISDLIRNAGGPDVYKAIMERVRETAVKPIVPRGVAENLLWYMRKNTLVAMMGASFNTFAINVLGASPMISRVGPHRYLRALQKLANLPQSKRYYKEVLEKSTYMKERIDSYERDMSAEVNRFTGKGGIMPDLGTWFIGLSIMDRMVTIPGWMAAYEKGLADNNNDEDLAIAFADRTVRQTQGSGRVTDLAKVAGGTGTAGEFKRIFTMFYSFFSAQLGMMVRSQRISSREFSEGQRVKAAMRLTLDTLAVIVIPATLEALARGQCDDENMAYCATRSSAMFTTSFFPILRDVLPYTWSQFDPDMPSYGVRLSPVTSAFEGIARTPASAYDIMKGDANETDYKNLVRGTGYLFGLPGMQAWRTIDGYQALSDGETDNPGVLLTGPPRE